MKKAVICGLYKGDYEWGNQEYLLSLGEVWVINDWYQFQPWITKPSRIYNLHKKADLISIKPGRFLGNWKKIYNKYIDNGTQCIMLEHTQGLNKQTIFDKKKYEQLGNDKCSCSIAIMITTAAIENYEEISIIGVMLNKDEYKNQIKGIINAVIFAKEKGVKVNWIPEYRYANLISELVNYKTIKSFKNYWER